MRLTQGGSEGCASTPLGIRIRLRSLRTIGGLSEVEARWDKIFLQHPYSDSDSERGRDRPNNRVMCLN
jgi:hypothetical protein